MAPANPDSPHPRLEAADAEALLGAVPLALLAATDDLVTWANPAAELLFGVPCAELVGRDVFAFIDTSESPHLRQRYFDARSASMESVRFVYRLRRPDGQIRPGEIEVRVLQAARPGRRVLLAFRDLTHRLERQDLIQALTELAAQLERARDPEALFTLVGDGLVALGLNFVVCELVPPDAFQATYLRVNDAFRQTLEGILGAELRGYQRPLTSLRFAREALASGRTYFEDDVLGSVATLFEELDPERKARLLAAHRELGFLHGVVSPILLHGVPWGLVTCGGARLTHGDSAALALFFTQLTSALESLESVRRLERRNLELEWLRTLTQVSERVEPGQRVAELLRITAEATRSEVVTLHRWELGRDLLRLTHQHGYDGPILPHQRDAQIGIISRRVLTGHASYTGTFEDLPEPWRSELAEAGLHHAAMIALRVHDRVVGALGLLRREDSPYTAEDLAWAEVVTQQVAVQLENRRLQDETERRVQDLALINELGGVITQSLELDRVLETGVQNLASLLGVDNVFLLLLETSGEQESLRLVASSKPGDPLLQKTLPFTRPSLLARALDERRPLVADHPGRDPRVNPAYVKLLDVESVLIVPLFSRSRALGFVVVGEDRPGQSFGAAAVDRAAAVTNQLATAITNAQLFEAERRRVEELRSFLEVSRLVAASLELGEILSASIANLANVANATHAFVWLLDRDGVHLRGAEASDPAHRVQFRTTVISVQGASASGMAVRTRAAVRIFDTRRGEVIAPSLNERFGMLSVLAIPLLVRDEPIGVVSFGDNTRPRHWTDAELERGTLMSRQVAVAVSNARLFEDLRQSYHELARTQEALLRRERLAALGELSAVMAHEVRNPLGVIFNALGGLQKILKPTGDAALLFGMLEEEADRLDRIVGDLLDFARPKEPEFRSESMQELVAGALEAADRVGGQRQSQIEVEIALAPDLPRIPLDPRMMRQALVNLIINALQAMEREGGVLSVVGVVKDVDGEPNLELAVRDTGPGISAEVTNHIFEPFFTTKAAGTGLGLSVVKHIVEAHRGQVRVEHRDPMGTSFVVTLPLNQPRPRTPER